MVTRDKEGHYIMIKGSTHQEDITMVNIYVPDIRASKYTKHILTTKRRNKYQYNNSWKL